MPMALPDPARRFSLRPSLPAVQRSRDAAVVEAKAARASAKLEKATSKAAKRAARNAPDADAEGLPPDERREREGVLRQWWSQNAEPFAGRLRDSEYEAFYASARSFFIERTLEFNEWRQLVAAFRSATTPPAVPDPNYWKHRGTSNDQPSTARLEGW